MIKTINTTTTPTWGEKCEVIAKAESLKTCKEEKQKQLWCFGELHYSCLLEQLLFAFFLRQVILATNRFSPLSSTTYQINAYIDDFMLTHHVILLWETQELKTKVTVSQSSWCLLLLILVLGIIWEVEENNSKWLNSSLLNN